MAISPHYSTDVDAWLATFPDPVPSVLSRRLAGRMQLLAVLAAGIALTVLLASELRLPSGWLIVGLAWAFVCIAAATTYVRSLKRSPHVDSYLDLLLSIAWRTGKYLILANLLWSGYDLLNGALVAELGYAFIIRAQNARPLLLGDELNILQLACLLPWWTPLRYSMRTAKRARDYEHQLAPRSESLIARNIRKSRRLIAQGKTNSANVLIKETSEMLSSLAGQTRDRGLIYHRRLLREKLDALSGKHPSEDFQRDPFGESAQPDMPAHTSDNSCVSTACNSQAPKPADPSAPDAGYEKYRDFVQSLREKSTVSWNQVAGLNDVVGELKTAFAMAMAEVNKRGEANPKSARDFKEA